MTIEEKAKRFDETLEQLKGLIEVTREDKCDITEEDIINIFPELRESEDELVWLTKYIEEEAYSLSMDIRDNEDRIKLKKLQKSLAWLEKQESVGEIVSRCKDSWYNEGKIQGQIEGLSDEEKYQQGWHDALEKQGEQPRYSIGDVLCDKSCTTLNKDAQPNFEITDIRNGMYICDKCSFPISQQDEYELVAKKIEQKPAWSEVDKDFMYDTLSNLTELKDRYGEGYGNVGKCIDWLKSLRPQNHWKPTKDQMKALHDLNLTGGISYAGQGQVLIELYNDLKKL